MEIPPAVKLQLPHDPVTPSHSTLYLVWKLSQHVGGASTRLCLLQQHAQ